MPINWTMSSNWNQDFNFIYLYTFFEITKVSKLLSKDLFMTNFEKYVTFRKFCLEKKIASLYPL